MGKILTIADLQDKCSATSRGLELAHRLGHSAEVVAFTYAPLKRLKVTNAEQFEIKRGPVAKVITSDAAKLRFFKYWLS